MVPDKNVECTRCGRQWYSEDFYKENELPDLCPHCYRDSVQKIPDPPTRVDKLKEKIGEKREEIPVMLKEKKHQVILWKENNKMLLSMVATGLIMVLIVSVITYLLFIA